MAGLQAKVGRTELTTEDGTTFIHSYHGSGTYAKVMGEIDAAGLVRPTFGDTVVLVHSAWQNPKEKFSKEIIQLMKSDWLVADTAILYVPNEGAYVQDHPQTNENGWPVMDKMDLAEKLEAGDKAVRFAELDYQTSKMSVEALAKNKFIQALCGSKETSQMIVELAQKYSDKPYLWAFDNVDSEITRVASLDSGCSDSRLLVDGYFHESDRYGYAFGKVAPDKK
jgi:hypothetical protein